MQRLVRWWQQSKIARRRRRQRLARLLLIIFVLLGLREASAPTQHDLLTHISSVTLVQQFDFVDWMSQAIVGEIRRRVSPQLLPPTAAAQRQLIDSYLKREQEIRRLEDEIDRIYATAASPGDAAAALERELVEQQSAQLEILPQLESILARQVEAVLLDEGFGGRGSLIPPVAFRLVDPPTALILSPRDRIENQYFVGLQPNLDNRVRTEIEDTLNRRGDVSSYITNVGGLGSFPTMVINTTNFPALVDIIAHEWTHNYLFTFPTNIAWGYQTYPRLTTINETTATIVGEEISRKVISRYYPDWVDHLPPLNDEGRPTPPEPSEFHLEMRRIRQTVDELLAQGKIEEAETFMEQERLKLVEKGYNLRRLNQAYFAFHGSYALSPSSIDPIGPQLRRLRAASLSLKDFVDQVGWLNSYNDYRLWLKDDPNINLTTTVSSPKTLER